MSNAIAYTAFGAIDLSTLVQQGGGAFVSKIVVDTNLLPQISIDDPFGANASAAGSDGSGDEFDPSTLFLKLLKPKVTAYTAQGPVSIAPFGEPNDPSYWPFVSIGLVAVGLLAIYGGYRLVRG